MIYELFNSVNDMIGYPKAKSLFEEVSEREPEEIIDYLKEFGSKWTNGVENEDDITFVVIKVK